MTLYDFDELSIEKNTAWEFYERRFKCVICGYVVAKHMTDIKSGPGVMENIMPNSAVLLCKRCFSRICHDGFNLGLYNKKKMKELR